MLKYRRRSGKASGVPLYQRTPCGQTSPRLAEEGSEKSKWCTSDFTSFLCSVKMASLQKLATEFLKCWRVNSKPVVFGRASALCWFSDHSPNGVKGMWHLYCTRVRSLPPSAIGRFQLFICGVDWTLLPDWKVDDSRVLSTTVTRMFEACGCFPSIMSSFGFGVWLVHQLQAFRI